MLIRIFIFGCCTFSLVAQTSKIPAPSSDQPRSPTDQKTVLIAQEARAVTKALGDACQRLDIDGAVKDWLDDSSTLAVSSEGYFVEPKALREGLRAFYSNLSNMRFTTIRDEVRVLSPDLVLQAWCYKVEGTGKNGSRFAVDTETATFLLRKINGEWKIIFFQESAAPAKRLSAPNTNEIAKPS